MAASSSTTGTSPGNSSQQPRIRSSSEEDHLDQKKRKRLASNRESARRSRLKKQNHLNNLMAEMKILKEENNRMVQSMSLSTQLYLDMETENSVIRAQMAELSCRLLSLKEIINFISSSCYGACATNISPFDHNNVDDYVMNNEGYFPMNVPSGLFYMNQGQPSSMADPDCRFI